MASCYAVWEIELFSLFNTDGKESCFSWFFDAPRREKQEVQEKKAQTSVNSFKLNAGRFYPEKNNVV